MTCIEVPNKRRNVYTYCDNTFGSDIFLRHHCKLDSCRLCCAIHDQPFKGPHADVTTTGECFQACADRYKPSEKEKGLV